MMFYDYHIFSNKLCAALGIDPATTSGIELLVTADDLVTVKVYTLVTQDIGEKIIEVLKEYTLTPKEAA